MRARCRRALPALLGVAVAGCATAQDRVTAPASPQAEQIDGLWTLSLWLGVGVWVTVMVLAAIPLWRSRRYRNRDPHADERRSTAGGTHDPKVERPDRIDGMPEKEQGRPHAPAGVLDEPAVAADVSIREAANADQRVRARLLWIGGIIVPAIILLTLLIASGRVSLATAHIERPGELVVDVTGHKFWWEVSYPEYDVVTANEIHLPVDRPVRLRLYSEDVIHSFWVPRLHGKIDLIPGQENWLSFEPTEVGRFRGLCAEFCGVAHAQMLKYVEVSTEQDFAAWIEEQQQPAEQPQTDRTRQGEQMFLEAGCASCHAVQGTEALGAIGPDLTHLGSRQTLAAGIVPNDRDHLEELILRPASVKPGIRMPATQLTAEELDVLLDYLETLGVQR